MALTPAEVGACVCEDMRVLNQCTLPDPHQLPPVDEMHAAVGGCQLWGQIYFVSGVWQVALPLTQAVMG